MESPYYGSRFPISHENHELFETYIDSLGIYVRSRRVMSFDVRDLKIKNLARIDSQDQNYHRDIAYVEQHVDIEHISKESELRQLRSCWDDLRICYLDNDNGKLIIRNGVEILIPKAARQDLVQELHLEFLLKCSKMCL